MGNQHPSPNVKTLCNFEPQICLEVRYHHVMPEVHVENFESKVVGILCGTSDVPESMIKNSQLWGSQHPSPNVKNPLRIRAENWLEIITSRDAKSACFQGSQTSCTEIISGVFWPKFGRKRSHHVMDAACWTVSFSCFQVWDTTVPEHLF